MKHRFIHTLWTKPFVQKGQTDKLEMQKYLYGLSLAYLRQLDCEVCLYTDELGYSLLGGLPYTEIHACLDQIIPQDISPVYFACCKAYALLQEPLGVIHIDGDVFIKSQAILDRCFNHTCDVLVQNVEPFVFSNNRTAFGLLDGILCKTRLADGIMYPELHDFNVGTLGFFNEEAKQKYIDNYLTLMLAANAEIPEKTYQINSSYFATPDLVMEHGQLYWLCKKNDYRVQVLLCNATPEICYTNATELGYCHLICHTKYERINDVKRKLIETFPDVYHAIVS